jgi:hypothetical protein
MSNSLNILVGAGFSYYAGLPLAKDIQSKFDRSLSNQLLRFGSSEWAWVETQDQAMQHNGRIGADAIEYGFILEEIIKDYKYNNSGNFIDYEDFYQYVMDKASLDGWYEAIIDSAATRFYTETELKDKNSEYYGRAFKQPERYLPKEIVNYLIMDLLTINKTWKELIENYTEFLNFIKQYEEVNIFSLNHDLVFECLFKKNNISYCDGFSSVNSSIYHQSTPQRIFQNEFSTASIKLIKLHGSIDMYAFEHGIEKDSVVQLDGYYTYFKPEDYRSKHYAVRVDHLNSDNILQRYNSNITPRFITGKNKQIQVATDYMYSQLHQMFQHKIIHGKELLIIGYSFGDPHINAVLNSFTTAIGPNIINFNYKDCFPYSAPSIKEIKKFEQL